MTTQIRLSLRPTSSISLPWGLAVLALAMSVLELVVALQNERVTSHGLGAADLVFPIAVFLPPVTFTMVGAFVVTQQPGNRIGWLMLAVGLGFAALVLTLDYPGVAPHAHQPTRPAGEFIAWCSTWIPSLYLIWLVLLFLLFPTGELPHTRWRPVLWIGVIAWSAEAVLAALRKGPLDSIPIDNPFGLIGVPDVLVGAASLGGFLAMGGAVVSLLVRFRSARGEVRQQLKWFAYAAVVAITFDIATALSGWAIFGVVAIAATASVPLCMGIAILRYRLYDIDLIINRTLVYGGLSLGVIVIYVLVVGYFTGLLHVHNTAIPSLLVTALVALAFQPARTWLQQRVNRLLFGERDTPYAVLARLGERLAEAFDPVEVLPTLARSLAESLKLPYVAITIEGQELVDRGAAVGVQTGDLVSFPLVHQGERVGHLLVCPRRGEPTITETDRDLLQHLAQRAGVAVHSVRLTRHLQQLSEDLQHSRERLVLAQEEERSRLRNDLHDDLAPRLAGLALSAGTIAHLVPRDPARAAGQAWKLEASIREAVGEVRRLVYDLRPPTLDDLGLLAAIQERAEQFNHGRPGGGGLAVRTQLPDALSPLPAAIEVAIYRIVQEALMNVERHASAQCCSIQLVVNDGLRLEIVDDGAGLPEDFRSGVGLRSMRERAEELGGQFALKSSEGGGTCVVVTFPFPATVPA
jgi:signal transduction histidine kinase